MNTRPLGRSAIRVAPVVFGGNVFGWTVDQPTAFRLLDRFVDAGLNSLVRATQLKLSAEEIQSLTMASD